jgi:hypothetical protein
METVALIMPAMMAFSIRGGADPPLRGGTSSPNGGGGSAGRRPAVVIT